jgi:hypothetical protein
LGWCDRLIFKKNIFSLCVWCVLVVVLASFQLFYIPSLQQIIKITVEKNGVEVDDE